MAQPLCDRGHQIAGTYGPIAIITPKMDKESQALFFCSYQYLLSIYFLILFYYAIPNPYGGFVIYYFPYPIPYTHSICIYQIFHPFISSGVFFSVHIRHTFPVFLYFISLFFISLCFHILYVSLIPRSVRRRSPDWHSLLPPLAPSTISSNILFFIYVLYWFISFLPLLFL